MSEQRITRTLRVLMPTYGRIEPMTLDSLLQLRDKVPYQISMVGTSEVAVSRTILADTALQTNADLLLWVDSDMAFIPEQFAVMHQALEAQPEMGLLSALAVRRDGSNTFCVNWRQGKKDWTPMDRLQARVLRHIENDEIAPVDVAGFAFTLMFADVFKKIKKPWFQPRWLEKGESGEDWQFFGEDSSFINKMKTAGYRPSVHFGIHVGHIGSQVYTPPPPKAYLEQMKREQEEEQNANNPVDPDTISSEDQSEDQGG